MDAPSHSSSRVTPRTAEYVIPIDAPPDAVWKALTDPTELERWFPLTASVTPGVGGALELRWGTIGMDDLAIFVWKPGRHLQVGMPQPSGAPRVIHDFTIEDHGTSTILRLVAHGFDPDARWDEFFDGVKRGWRYELQSLRHYLEHHRGEDRAVAWVRTPIAGGAERAWATLFASLGWKRRDDRYSIEAPDGTVLTGTVVISEHPKDFTGTVEELNNAVLRAQIEAEPDGLVLGLWLEAWGVPATKLAAIEAAWQPALDNLFSAD
ncbi:MAG TPA: SRPBCC domain-containing protein [Gemmatimonadaceae bacterium]|nr:SRPBCC domain-containing protein [Gemmatimonadaceae bacterium]